MSNIHRSTSRARPVSRVNRRIKTNKQTHNTQHTTQSSKHTLSKCAGGALKVCVSVMTRLTTDNYGGHGEKSVCGKCDSGITCWNGPACKWHTVGSCRFRHDDEDDVKKVRVEGGLSCMKSCNFCETGCKQGHGRSRRRTAM